MDKQYAVIKSPGLAAKVVEVKKISYEFLSEAVGGYIEPYNPAWTREPVLQGLTIYTNEEGRRMGLPLNVNFHGAIIVGTFVVVDTDGPREIGLDKQTADQVALALDKYTITTPGNAQA